jgi:hypothetical protein
LLITAVYQSGSPIGTYGGHQRLSTMGQRSRMAKPRFRLLGVGEHRGGEHDAGGSIPALGTVLEATICTRPAGRRRR